MNATFRRQAITMPRWMLKRLSQNKLLPAPTRGWVTAANLANAQPGQALTLENFFPTQTGIQPRGGRQKHATIGTAAVERVFDYSGPAGNKLFAADTSKIFDITSPADPTIAPAAAVTGQSNGYYSTALFTTSGGTYLIAVNGADKMLQFDGTTWTAIDSGSSPIAITGYSTAALSAVWIYENRLFFIVGGTLDVQYLPVDSVGGALGQKSLGGIFKHGGSLLFGATWSHDSGDGLHDLCAMVTDNGEMAVFLGSNPAGSSVGDFDLVGRYDLSIPMGKNVTMRAGADLLVLTQDGVVPVSAALTKDVAALSLSAVSKAIEPEWQMQVRSRGGTPWEVAKWPSHNLAIVSIPAVTDDDDKFCFVVNVETGAWCKYTNWDARSLEVFNDRLFFGDRDGVIWEGEVTGNDGGDTIYCTYVGEAEHLGAPGSTKVVRSMRSSWVAAMAFNAKLSCSVNYTINVPSPPSVAPVVGPGWDLSLWDVDVWDAPAPAATIQTRWVSIGVTGFAANPQIQVSSNSEAPLDIQLVTLDVLYEVGGVMV